ncbi:VOC family protein [Bacillus sp. FJAT-29814]|uniref:VOC family protein n=1 Tax=Bacillus sp. FJAT-29814 TaxID=1729688 RepID=UPI00082BDDFA|nr:VOC family protein [Bacillus sp. FJAT-29814]
MNTKVTKVPYVAIAVKDMHKAADFFANTFGGEIISKGTVEEELYLDCMVKIGDFCLYLMEPMSEESVIGRYISKNGEGLHHLCFTFQDPKLALAELREKGLRVNSIYFDVDDIELGFMHPKDAYGVLLELTPETVPLRTDIS